jgi:deazaflavin-dependent oxidoreductase (nitroreductase family)
MAQHQIETRARRAFSYLNRYFMVPLFRLGLGGWMGTPFGGYIMVLKVIGRKTGRTRYAPVNYAVENGSVYCLAGFGATSDWYRNVLAHPQIEVLMPGGAIAGLAEEVVDADERARMIRRVLINGGFAGFFYGYDPRTVSDERLIETTREVPVLRIRPRGIGSGASDPGGWAWIITILVNVALVAWLVKRRQKDEG